MMWTGILIYKVEVDSSKVKKDVPGTYKAIYAVTDTAGNKAEKEITVTVTAKKQKTEQAAQTAAPGQTQQRNSRRKRIRKQFYRRQLYDDRNIWREQQHSGK